MIGEDVKTDRVCSHRVERAIGVLTWINIFFIINTIFLSKSLNILLFNSSSSLNFVNLLLYPIIDFLECELTKSYIWAIVC